MKMRFACFKERCNDAPEAHESNRKSIKSLILNSPNNNSKTLEDVKRMQNTINKDQIPRFTLYFITILTDKITAIMNSTFT